MVTVYDMQIFFFFFFFFFSSDDIQNEKTILDMHTILVATTGSVIGILLIVLALICEYVFFILRICDKILY